MLNAFLCDRTGSLLFDCNDIQTDRNADKTKLAGILKNIKRFHPFEVPKFRLMEKGRQDIKIKSHIMIIVWIDMPPEHHTDYMKSVL